MVKLTRVFRIAICGMILGAAAIAQVPDQYPTPLPHTKTNHPAAHVLLLSVDGLHAIDLANWVAVHPKSALAELSRRGVTYTNAHTTAPFPAAGLVSLATGGTPISTGIVSDRGYDRAPQSPTVECNVTGSAILLDGSADTPGSSGLSSLNSSRGSKHGCAPVPTHSLVRVNTMFEVIHQKIGPTAFAGEDGTITDLLSGPSGQGVDDPCAELHAVSGADKAIAPLDADETRVKAVLHWIDGQDCAGDHQAPVPILFGISFRSVAVAQATPGMGYTDATGTPSAGLAKSMAFVDDAIGKIVQELKAKALYDSTWIVVTSPYGQSPIDHRMVRHVPMQQLKTVAERVHVGLVRQINGGDVAMIWLSNIAETDAVVKAYEDHEAALGIAGIYSGARLQLTLNLPEKDSRMPNIILQAEPGVIWGPLSDKSIAAYGGVSDEDTHIALLVSGAQLTGRFDPTWVPTSQLAPLLMRALGLEKFDLQALHLEHSPALPGIF